MTIRLAPRVKYCRVDAGPKLCRVILDVVREFDAASQEVFTVDGIVAESPMSSSPVGVFLIDWNASGPKIMLLITFMESPLVSGVEIARELTKVPTLTVLSTVTGLANPEEVKIFMVLTVI